MCEICQKAFNQKNALQMHLRKHSGDKQHQCPYCPNAFVQKGNLKTHIKRSHHTDMVNSMTGKKETESKATVQTDSQAMAQDIGLGEVENLFNN